MLLKIVHWMPSSEMLFISHTNWKHTTLVSVEPTHILTLTNKYACMMEHTFRTEQCPPVLWHTAGWSCACVRGCHQSPSVPSYLVILDTVISAVPTMYVLVWCVYAAMCLRHNEITVFKTNAAFHGSLAPLMCPFMVHMLDLP